MLQHVAAHLGEDGLLTSWKQHDGLPALQERGSPKDMNPYTEYSEEWENAQRIEEGGRPGQGEGRPRGDADA